MTCSISLKNVEVILKAITAAGKNTTGSPLLNYMAKWYFCFNGGSELLGRNLFSQMVNHLYKNTLVIAKSFS
jgi:hypothetical protein